MLESIEKEAPGSVTTGASEADAVSYPKASTVSVASLLRLVKGAAEKYIPAYSAARWTPRPNSFAQAGEQTAERATAEGPRRIPGPEALASNATASNPQARADLGEGTARMILGPAAETNTAEAVPAMSAREGIPVKAQNCLQRAERALIRRTGDALGVWNYLQGIKKPTVRALASNCGHCNVYLSGL